MALWVHQILKTMKIFKLFIEKFYKIIFFHACTPFISEVHVVA